MNTPPTLQEAAVFENFSDPPIIKPPVYPEAVLHHAADTLEESEASYRCLFEFNPHPMWIYDRETLGFLLVNEAAIEHYAYSRNEFLAMTIKDIRPAEDIPLLLEAAMSRMRGRGKRGVWRHKKKNGQIIDVEITVHDLYFRGRAARLGLVNDITEHRRIERVLQQSEQEQRQLAEHLEKERERLAEAQAIAKVGSWEHDLTTNVLFWSEETYRIFGMDPVGIRVSYEAFLERVHPDDRADVTSAYAASVANRTPYAIDHRTQMKNGSIKIVHERCRTFYDTAGCPIRSVGTVQDITEQKQTEQKLTQSLDFLRAVTEGTTDAIFAKDLQGRYLMINTQGAQFVGKTPEEIIGQDDTLLFSAETADNAIAIDSLVMESGVISEMERVGVAVGVTRTFQTTKGPLRDHSGNIVGGVGISRDISERKQVELTLQHIMEGAHCLLWQAEVQECGSDWLQWKMQFAGEQAAQRFIPLHVTMERDYVSAWYHACPVDDRARIDLYGVQEIRAGRSYQQEFRIHSKEGTLHWLSENVRVETLGEGKWRCTGVCTDITPVKEAEIALRAANEELEARVACRTAQITQTNTQLVMAKQEADKANHAKSEFLSRMSHELRTPLNAILGFGQILNKEPLTPLQKESVQYVLKGGRHLLDLINEVLDFARVEAGHIELSLEPIDLIEIVSEACTLIRPLAAESNIVLDASAVPGRIHVLADRQRLKQVLLNLLSNGIKYNRPGGQVRVHCTPRPNDRLCIAVQDTGPGITPDEQQRLFTPFERLNGARSGAEGTGLGLVLSQRLVIAMGGRLTFESTAGEGTTFCIELPLAAPPEERLAEEFRSICEPDPYRSERSATVLTIEDNLSNLRLMEVVLRSRPEITLMAAMQGSVGLDLARQHEPDLILLDLNLPDISGREVLARLQASALTRDIPVIILSADATASQIERLRSAGAGAYLTKPLDVTEFLHTLDTLLAGKKTPASRSEEFTI